MDVDEDGNDDTESTSNVFSKRMNTMLRNLDASLAQKQGTARRSASTSTSSTARDDTDDNTSDHVSLTASIGMSPAKNAEIRKSKKSFVELQEEMVALLNYEPFHSNRTFMTLETTIPSSDSNDQLNQNSQKSAIDKSLSSTTNGARREKRALQQPKRVHWEEGKEEVEEEDLQLIPTPPRIMQTPPEAAAKSVFWSDMFSPPPPPTTTSIEYLVQPSSVLNISEVPAVVLPLEFDTDITTSTQHDDDDYYYRNTQPPTYSPLLSRRRYIPTSTTNLIMQQRPHSAPTKPLLASTENKAVEKQSPVDELKNRLRIYAATTKSRKHSRMHSRPKQQQQQQISSTAAATTATSITRNTCNRYNEKAERTDLTATISTDTTAAAISTEEQLRYQKQLIAQYQMEIDNLNKVNMYQKAEIIKYETALSGMKKGEEPCYKPHNIPQHGQTSSITPTGTKLGNNCKQKLYNHIIIKDNNDNNNKYNNNHLTNSYHPTNATTNHYCFFKELRQIVKWRQRAIQAELYAHELKQKEEELCLQYHILQQQYGQSLETIHSLEDQYRRTKEQTASQAATTHHLFLQQRLKYEEACPQTYLLEQKQQQKQSSYRLTAKAAIKQLISSNSDNISMLRSHHNRCNDTYSSTEECEELCSRCDALQSQLEQTIELIYFLEEELHIEKIKKNNSLQNNTNNEILRRIPEVLQSSNGSTQSIDSVATEEVSWNSLTGLPLLTQVVNTMKEALLMKSNIQCISVDESQQTSIYAALHRLRDFQSTLATSKEEGEDVNDQVTTTSWQGGDNLFEENGFIPLTYNDSDEEKNPTGYIRNLHMDFMEEELEDGEKLQRDGPTLSTNDNDCLLGLKKVITPYRYYQRLRDKHINAHDDDECDRMMWENPKENEGSAGDKSSPYGEWTVLALREKCLLLESERDRIVAEALDLVHVTKREAKASAEARMAVLRFAFSQKFNVQESKFQRSITDLESQFYQKLLLIIEKKNSMVLKWKTFLTWRLRIISKRQTTSLNRYDTTA